MKWWLLILGPTTGLVVVNQHEEFRVRVNSEPPIIELDAKVSPQGSQLELVA